MKRLVSNLPITQTILVPQGAEYKAVCRGLSRVKPPIPLVVPIPVSPKPVTRYLERWQQAGHFLKYPKPKVLLMGLCGSLSPHYAIGDIVLYQDCVYESNRFTPSSPRLTSPPTPLLQGEGSSTPPFPGREGGGMGPPLGMGGMGGLGQPYASSIEPTPLSQACDSELTTLLHQKLKERVSLVRALTSDRIIFSAQEKHHLGQLYSTQVVDMEGFAALEVLTQAGMAVAMVRVISDDSHHNLPNLTSALSPDGSLKPLPLAFGMMRQPIAATQLIRGALQGLRVLQEVTTLLFSE